MSKLRRTIKRKNNSSLESQISFITKNFDFNRVHEFMSWNKSSRNYDDNGICYGTNPWNMFVHEEYRVPTEFELKTLADSLLKEVANRYRSDKSDYIYIHHGPFKAICRYGILELDCVIESWSGDD